MSQNACFFSLPTFFKHRITSTVTTVFSAFSCFGLVAVSTWFASERWIFNRHKGKKWLGDVLSETKEQLYSAPVVGLIIRWPRTAARKAVYWSRRQSRDASDFLSILRKKIMSLFRSHGTPDTPEPAGNSSSPIPTPLSPEPLSPTIPHHRPSDVGTLPFISEGLVNGTGHSVDGSEEKTMTSDTTSVIGQVPVPKGKKRFREAAETVIMLRSVSAATTFGSSLYSPRRQRTMSSDGLGMGSPKEAMPGMLRSSRVASLVPKLKSMQTTQDLAAHAALVRHIQFSPDGNFLATARFVCSREVSLARCSAHLF